MQTGGDIDELRARVTELEERNRELSEAATTHRKARFSVRGLLAAILIIASVLIAPAAAVGTWVRVQLVDTDRFVGTFAPLAAEPSVQEFVADQAVDAIDESIDIDAVVGALFEGLEALDLPAEAAATLPLLEAPTATGIRSLVHTSVGQVVASEQFAQVWEGVLRQTHSTAIAVIQDDPDAALELSDDGTISLKLGPVIEEVKQRLIEQDMGFAEQIPAIDRSIPLVTSESFTAVRSVYQLAVAGGTLLPWVTLGLLAAGVAVARRRTRALMWGGIGLAASFLFLAAGIGIGRLYFVGTVSPAIMPSSTANALFAGLTEAMHSTTIALVVASACIAIGAWLSGASRASLALRGLVGSGFSAILRSAATHGITTGKFGETVERLRPALQVVAAVIAVLLLFLIRPITTTSVIWVIVVLLLVLAVIELVRRPANEVGPEIASAEPDTINIAPAANADTR